MTVVEKAEKMRPLTRRKEGKNKEETELCKTEKWTVKIEQWVSDGPLQMQFVFL